MWTQQDECVQLKNRPPQIVHFILIILFFFRLSLVKISGPVLNLHWCVLKEDQVSSTETVIIWILLLGMDLKYDQR